MTMKLRRWHDSDLETLVQIANNKKIANNLTNKFPHPYTIEAGKAFIAFANTHTPRHINAIEIDGQIAGGIGIHPQEDISYKNAEMGYWLGEAYWGKGIMTQAVKEMVNYGFKNFDINRIFARPFGTNVGSQKVLEKVGFILEARFEKTLCKNGTYHDELIYAIRR